MKIENKMKQDLQPPPPVTVASEDTPAHTHMGGGDTGGHRGGNTDWTFRGAPGLGFWV